jgi:hypothetical protein
VLIREDHARDAEHSEVATAKRGRTVRLLRWLYRTFTPGGRLLARRLEACRP